MTAAFDNADYYDCGDPENLSHDTVEEALEDYIDGLEGMSPECDVAALIEANSPITVSAYTRKAVHPADAADWARDMAENLNEWWREEEYADPDGDGDGPGDTAFVKALIPLIEAAIARTTVWACDNSGEREYSAEEVLALMRKRCPSWFEKTPTSSATV